MDKLSLWKRRLKVPSPYKVKHCLLCMSALSVDTKYSEEMAEEHINTSVGAECGGTAPAVCTGTTEHRCCAVHWHWSRPGDLNWRTHAGCSRPADALANTGFYYKCIFPAFYDHNIKGWRQIKESI